KRVQRMAADQYGLFDTLRRELEGAGIRLLDPRRLTSRQRDQLLAIFHDSVSPLLTPLAIHPDEEPPLVPALQVIVACRVVAPETGATRHALVPVPESIGRRVQVSDDGENLAFLLAEDL